MTSEENIYGEDLDLYGKAYVTLRNHPTREKVEGMIGGSIPGEIWEFQPWGSRVLVRRDKVSDMIGSLYVPDSANELLASGTIVKVGPGVGTLEDSDCPYSDPANLVGVPVIFGQWAGKVLMTSDDSRKDPYSGHWLLMHENDFWGHTNTFPQKLESLVG